MNERDVKIGLKVKVVGCGSRGRQTRRCDGCFKKTPACDQKDFIGKIVNTTDYHMYAIENVGGYTITKYASSFEPYSNARIERMAAI